VEWRASLIPKIVNGYLLLAFAHAECQSRYDLADVASTARKDGSNYVLDGAKTLIVHGDCADKLIVSARLAGERRDQHGIGLFLIDADAAGLSRRGYPTVDGLRAAEVTLAGVRVCRGGNRQAGNAFPLIARVVDAAIAALAAEAVGAMAAFQLTVDYLKTRSSSACRSASRCCSTRR
jgi:alkylation response protein AidB-like acyl-CoA dehydrogenase